MSFTDIGARVNTDYWKLKYCQELINWIIGTSHITTCSSGTLLEPGYSLYTGELNQHTKWFLLCTEAYKGLRNNLISNCTLQAISTDIGQLIDN